MQTAVLRRRALGVGLVAMLASSPGQTYMVSAFHGSWTAELGLSKTELGSWYAGGSVAASLCLVAVGRLSDSRGPRFTLALVALALAAGCGVMSLAAGGLSLALGFFLIRLFGQGSMGLVSGHAVALAFDKGLGKAEGLRVSAISVAVGLAPGLAVWLIDVVGWRTAYLVLGAAVVAAVVPASRLLPRPRAAVDANPSDSSGEATGVVPDDEGGDRRPDLEGGHSLAEALRTRNYALIGAAIVLHAAGVTAVHFHSQPLFGALGLDGPVAAARGMSVFAACMLAASLSGGWFVDRTRTGVPFAVSSTAMGASLLLLDGRLGAGGAFAGMGLLGLAQGLAGVAIVPSVAACFGRRHFGAVRGSFATLTVAGASLGPIVLGYAADRGGFAPGLQVFAACCIPVAALSWCLIRPRPATANSSPGLT